VVHVYCGLPVRFHACSPPRLAATQLAQSSVLNRLIAPAGLSPALTPASRAHRSSSATTNMIRADQTAQPVKRRLVERLRGIWGLGKSVLPASYTINIFFGVSCLTDSWELRLLFQRS